MSHPNQPGDCHCSQWQGQRNWVASLKFQAVFEKGTRDLESAKACVLGRVAACCCD